MQVAWAAPRCAPGAGLCLGRQGAPPPPPPAPRPPPLKPLSPPFSQWHGWAHLSAEVLQRLDGVLAHAAGPGVEQHHHQGRARVLVDRLQVLDVDDLGEARLPQGLGEQCFPLLLTLPGELQVLAPVDEDGPGDVLLPAGRGPEGRQQQRMAAPLTPRAGSRGQQPSPPRWRGWRGTGGCPRCLRQQPSPPRWRGVAGHGWVPTVASRCRTDGWIDAHANTTQGRQPATQAAGPAAARSTPGSHLRLQLAVCWRPRSHADADPRDDGTPACRARASMTGQPLRGCCDLNNQAGGSGSAVKGLVPAIGALQAPAGALL
jgi:hypothetical protein